jgi:hypothetical protein
VSCDCRKKTTVAPNTKPAAKVTERSRTFIVGKTVTSFCVYWATTIRRQTFHRLISQDSCRKQLLKMFLGRCFHVSQEITQTMCILTRSKFPYKTHSLVGFEPWSTVPRTDVMTTAPYRIF